MNRFGVLALHVEVLVAGGYRGGFCEKLPETSPMTDRANASQLQEGPLLAKAEPISDGGGSSGIT